MAETTASRTPRPAPAERAATAARRKAILDAAREVFLERGYADASVDSVVDKAGGSKATVYALFGNKEGLFSEVATACGEDFARAVAEVDVCTSLTESLRRVAHAYCKVAFDSRRIAMFRTMAGESGRRPDSGDTFYRLGPGRALDIVAKFFRKCTAAGLLESSEPERLADVFLGALRGNLYNCAVLNPTRIPTEAELTHHIDFVVDTLLKGIGGSTNGKR